MGMLFKFVKGKADEGNAKWLVCQGPCLNFPDCNEACLAKGFPEGGKCTASGPGAPLACCCNAD